MRDRIDFDNAPPVAVVGYRAMQARMPGGDALYATMCAIFEAGLPAGASILVSGAGGGHEIEDLGKSPSAFRLLGVDPSADMLAIAKPYADAVQPPGRATLIHGVAADLPADVLYDAATSVMIMHFLPDDGSKAAYLRAIRARLRIGAPYIHTDVTFDDPQSRARLLPVISRFAAIAGLPDFGAQLAGSQGVFPISEARTRALFDEYGFRVVAPIYRGLWFAGWWAEAA